MPTVTYLQAFLLALCAALGWGLGAGVVILMGRLVTGAAAGLRSRLLRAYYARR